MKLKDLPLKIYDQIEKLECENMLPLLTAAGVKSSETELKNHLRRAEEQEVLVAMDGETVTGFLIFHFTGQDLGITTLNLRLKYSRLSIDHLCRKLEERLRFGPIGIVKSAAFHLNRPSINLHKRLGFRVVADEGYRLRFEISTGDLAISLAKRRKRAELTSLTFGHRK